MREDEKNFQERAKSLIVQFSIFRWENGVLIAGVILLTAFYPKPFNWWPIWGWPVLGLIGLGALILSSLQNHKRNAALILESFQETFNVRTIRLPDLKKEVGQALEYQRRINDYLMLQNDSPIWDQANDTALQIQSWIEHVFQLATHLDKYKSDQLFKKEISELPGEIKKLQRQRAQEKAPRLLEEFDNALRSKEKHLATLRELDTKMKQAELQLENSLSALATVDSQIRLIAAQDVDRGRSDRLRVDIQEQINRLGDLLASISEVYEAR
jgi:vacuolar-type H+-ATPase subunit I/STV1